MKKVHKATFTVEVPIRLTFEAKETLDCEELIKAAEKAADYAVITGAFDVVSDKLSVIHKFVHYSQKEIEEDEKRWQEFLRGVGSR